MRLIDAHKFEAELFEQILPALVKKYGTEDALRALHFSFLDCICNIQLQPTVEPQNWISVKERLPENMDVVLVTVKWSEDDYEITTGEYWRDSKASPGWGSFNDNVTAWMPLPEPYKEATT